MSTRLCVRLCVRICVRICALAALAGCASGPSAETLVDELRVLAVVAEPPELGPGEATALSTRVVDPSEAGFDLVQWTCTRAGPACLEAEDPASAWAGLAHVDGASGGWFDGAYALPPFLEDALTEEPLPLVQVWTLACAPGLCPVIDAAAAAPAPGTAEAEALQAQLSDPAAFMEDLPLEGVSLALRGVLASTRVDGRLENPTVDCAPEDGGALEVEPGGALDVLCAVSGTFDGDAAAWGYTTAGGWEGPSQGLAEGDTEVRYRWIAPDGAGEVPVWVVVADGLGGLAAWEAVVTVL